MHYCKETQFNEKEGLIIDQIADKVLDQMILKVQQNDILKTENRQRIIK